MLQRKRLTAEQAVEKIKQYCAYQERSHAEVKEKLYSFGLNRTDVETALARMIEEDYLNEERYARLFSGGRFRMKKWGRVKIKHALKTRGVSEYCIRKALAEIPDKDYLATLQELLDKKLASLKSERNVLIKKRKLLDYLLQKGYEREIVMDILKQI